MNKLDSEWIDLIKEALKQGVPADEIRKYLRGEIELNINIQK